MDHARSELVIPVVGVRSRAARRLARDLR